MEKKQAYDYFLGKLQAKMIALNHQCDEVGYESPQFKSLSNGNLPAG